MQQIEFNIFYVIRSVRKHFKLFVILLSLATLGGVIVAFVLPVEYESKITFYPFSAESSDPRIMAYQQAEYGVFGYSDQTERYMNIGKSGAVRLRLAQKFNLYSKYGIDKGSPLADLKVIDEATKHINCKKGEQGAVVLNVYHSDRDTAALIANEMLLLIDSIIRSQFREKNRTVYELYKKQLENQSKAVAFISDSLSKLSKDNKNQMAVNSLQLQLKEEYAELATLRTKFEFSKVTSWDGVKSTFQIERGLPSYQKAKPFRKLIIGGSFVITFVLLIILFTTIEFIKDNKDKLEV